MELGDLVQEGLASTDPAVQDMAINIVSLAERLDDALDRAAQPILHLVS